MILECLGRELEPWASKVPESQRQDVLPLRNPAQFLALAVSSKLSEAG